MKDKAICPYCSYKLSYLDLFKMRPNSSFTCQNCDRMLEPKFHPLIQKTWDYTFHIGLLVVIIFCLIPYFITNNIILALKIGIIPILMTLPIYLFFIKKTTYFVKYY